MIKNLKNIFIYTTLLSLSFISNVYSLDVQYQFEKRFNEYSDAISNHHYVNNHYWYKHSEVLTRALNKINNANINYAQCQSKTNSDFVIILKPSFFYNPMLTTFYGDITINIFNEGKKIETVKFSEKLISNLNGNYQFYLQSLYIGIFDQITHKLLELPSAGKTDGSLCNLF